jgi:hypothetical protein
MEVTQTFEVSIILAAFSVAFRDFVWWQISESDETSVNYLWNENNMVCEQNIEMILVYDINDEAP